MERIREGHRLLEASASRKAKLEATMRDKLEQEIRKLKEDNIQQKGIAMPAKIVFLTACSCVAATVMGTCSGYKLMYYCMGCTQPCISSTQLMSGNYVAVHCPCAHHVGVYRLIRTPNASR